MKKFLCAVLCILLVLSALPAFARNPGASVEVMVVVNCNDFVSLRKTASTKADRLEKVHLGEFVYNCTPADNDFIQCTFDGKTGYILAKYLQATTFTASDPLLKNQMVYNCDEFVSLRESPDTKSNRLAKVPKNAAVTTCVTYDSDWIMCSYNGKTGYILSKYLKTADYDYIDSIKNKPTATPTVDPSKYEALPYYMTVTGVSEWATLRDRPSTTGNQLARVPLGAQVEDCERVSDTFVCCTYNGVRGYIRYDLLTTVKGFETLSDLPDYVTFASCGVTILANSYASGYSVLAQHMYTDSTEEMMVVCYDSKLNPLWSVRASCAHPAELEALSAFSAGTEAEPLVVLFNNGSGFTAYKVGNTKQIAWTSQEAAAQNITGSISAAVDEDGTIYVIGYYNNAPLCLNPDGTVRWQAVNTNSQLYWPFDIKLTEEGVEVYYDSYTADASYNCYKAVYTRDGVFSSVSTAAVEDLTDGTLYEEAEG